MTRRIACSETEGNTAVQTWWYKGNLHMHSLWSDGDDYPERIAARFKEGGYHFIAFTEHDRFQEGTPPPLEGRVGESGRDEGAGFPCRVGLKSLSLYRDSVEERGKFLILNGEEVTVHCGGRRHWINIINASRPIGPINSGGSSAEAIRSLVREAERLGHPCLVSFNHPNFAWNATAEDLAEAETLRFFEIHTALNTTNCYGDERRAGAERIWDIALALRLVKTGGHRLLGIATDDSHRYGSADAGPCRAWVMVKAPELTPEALIRSMKNGDFYASTGVTLANLETNPCGISMTIEQAAGVSYTTRFIGTRRGIDMKCAPVVDENGLPLDTTKEYTKEVGAVLGEVHGPEATYEFAGDEAYVRAVVTSDCPHPYPTVPGDVLKAWTQPVCPEALRPGVPGADRGPRGTGSGRESR